MAFKECLIAWPLFAAHSWHGRTCFLSSVLPARCQCLLSLSSSPLVKCKWWWVLPLANTPNQYMKYYFLQKYSYFPKEDTATLLTGEAFQGTKNRIKKPGIWNLLLWMFGVLICPFNAQLLGISMSQPLKLMMAGQSILYLRGSIWQQF